MIKKLAIIIGIFAVINANAQSPPVPSKMEFAGIKLKITESGRKEIQESVDALTRSKKYFDIKVARVNAFFPIIERVFAEQGVPDDFKYLVIQESALISDAVSTSNAVGFWQFKDFTGVEMGLNINSEVDERMNITAASIAAAHYFQRNNFFFNNWLNALQAYQMGAGGAQKVLSDKDKGAKSMTITKNTYWYVLKFLAHKVAFEAAAESNNVEFIPVIEYINGANKSLSQIAKETGSELEDLKEYNKWLKANKVPTDKSYAVIIPLKSGQDISGATSAVVTVKAPIAVDVAYPQVVQKAPERGPIQMKINGLPGIIGRTGFSVADLARASSLSVQDFREINDMPPHASVEDGQVYYIKRKYKKAKIYYHTVQNDESLWQVSQKYGVRLSRLVKFNALASNRVVLKPGRVLWLKKARPANSPIEYREVVAPPTLVVVETPIENLPEEKDPAIYPVENVVEVVNTNDSVATETTNLEGALSEPVQVIDSLAVMTQDWVEHIVEKGETLYSISKKYDMPVLEIVEFNKLNLRDGLSTGQKLKVVNMEPTQPKINLDQEQFEAETNSWHTVVVGDTMYNIAVKYGVTINQIQEWNNKQDYSLSLGEKLIIGKKD